MAYALDLIFREPSKKDLPGKSFAQICITGLTHEEEGHTLISPRCVCMKEIEEQIEYIKHDLEIIKKKAKQKFAKNK